MDKRGVTKQRYKKGKEKHTKVETYMNFLDNKRTDLTVVLQILVSYNYNPLLIKACNSKIFSSKVSLSLFSHGEYSSPH